MKHLLKKAFLLLALVGGVSSAWADATKVFDAAAAGWSAVGVDLTTGTTTVGDVTWNGGGSAAIASGSATIEGVSWDARLKFGGKSTFRTGKTLARVLTFTPSTAGTVKVYGVHGSTSGTRTFYISQSITSTDRDASTALGSFACTPENKSGVATAVVEKGKMVYIWCDDNIGIYGVTFEGSAAGPSISASDASIKATESGVEATQSIDVTGENLTGSTLTATLSPAVDGLSVTLGSNTITDGAISTTATLHYTATENAVGSTTLTLSDGTTSKEVTVNYNASVVTWELQTINSARTWDFSKLTGGVKYEDADLTVEHVYAGISEIGYSDDSFDKTALAFTGEYPLREGKTFAQNGTLRFNTSVPGYIVVSFSDTGSKASADAVKRYLVVNDVTTEYWASREKTGEGAYDAQLDVTTGPLAVSAGDVTIKGTSALVYSKVEFVPAVSATITSAGWATFSSAYAVSIPDGVEAYAVKYTGGNTVSLTQVTEVPANTGVILKADEGVYSLPVVASAAAIANNNLLVSDGTIEGNASTIYVLNKKNENVGFYKLDNGVKLEAGKAYLEIPANSEARGFIGLARLRLTRQLQRLVRSIT